ncbi:MAG: hypothetical protein QOE06_353 [Thermoleophilaceae bacterium]|nr:hypothetical protein [Thermoleophilaceae bacterium]
MAGLAPRAVAASCAALLLAGLAALAGSPPEASGKKRNATTSLFSHSAGGGTPNGPSTNPVISGDLHFAQIVAFESLASNLVAGDTNGLKDVFAVRRSGSFKDDGSAWKPGATQLVSRGPEGQPADGPSFDPSADGNAQARAKCVAFLSDATNLVAGDTNGVTDAFVGQAPDFKLTRVSLPDGAQATTPTTKVAISGDCSRAAFVTGGKLYVRRGPTTKLIPTKADPADPQYDSGDTNALVFGASGGVYLLDEGASNPKLLVKTGRNPAYINRRRGGRAHRYLVYETDKSGHSQIGYREIGSGGERIVTAWKGHNGNGDSREPTIFSSGVNVAFVSDASNLPTKTNKELGDKNGLRDAYLWTATQKITILESVDSDNAPLEAGAQNSSTSYYRNYVVFDSSANDLSGVPQIYMRYLGGA